MCQHTIITADGNTLWLSAVIGLAAAGGGVGCLVMARLLVITEPLFGYYVIRLVNMLFGYRYDNTGTARSLPMLRLITRVRTTLP